MPFISDQAIARVKASQGIQPMTEAAPRRLERLRPRNLRCVTIGDEVMVPLDIATRSIVIAGERADDRALAARTIAQELWARRHTVVFVDGTGYLAELKTTVNDRWDGIRLSVFGGQQADFALTGDMGGEIAARIAAGPDPSSSCVVDTSSLLATERDGLVGALVEGLRRRRRTQAVHLIVDDGDVLAPSQPDGDATKALAEIRKVFTHCMGLRMGITLMTGHPELLRMDFATEASALILLHTVDSRQRAAIGTWLRHCERSRIGDVLASLPTLPAGLGWVTTPKWLKGVLRMVHL